MNIIHQKYIILFILFSINSILSSTFLLYTKYWYIYLVLLALASITNAANSLLNLSHRMFVKNTDNIYRLHPINYTYIVPCYNESEEELRDSINSITTQQHIPGDKRTVIIICDGKVTGSGNNISTDIILKNILNPNFISLYKYTTWDNKYNTVELYTGEYNTIPYLLLIKQENYGKRDSIVLARKLCYNYNNYIIIDKMISSSLMLYVGAYFNSIYNNKSIKYIIGIDGDTIFDYYCSYELIKAIDRDDNCHGCVGLVDILPSMNMYTPFILYQYAEYMFAQCLKRQAQSNFTKKVNCLSGCNQILRISEETCGDKILSQFNYLPNKNENIFNHIRSYASEDRNHVCLVLSLYPHVKTIQTLKAVAYTTVPTSLKVFFSQRRRWCLGSNTNDMMLIYLPGINIFERILATINVMTFCVQPFIFIATIEFIKTIITAPTYLMLYLSILILIPFLYALFVPIFIRQLPFRDAIYYYISLCIFISLGSIINLGIYFYALLNMDIIKWGKTRTIKSINRVDTNEALEFYINDPNIKISNYVHEKKYDEFWELSDDDILGKEIYNISNDIII